MRPGTRCGSILCAAQVRMTELVMCVGHASMVRMIQLPGSTGARASPSVFTQSANSAPSAQADLRRTRCARVPRYCARSSSNSRVPMLFFVHDDDLWQQCLHIVRVGNHGDV